MATSRFMRRVGGPGSDWPRPVGRPALHKVASGIRSSRHAEKRQRSDDTFRGTRGGIGTEWLSGLGLLVGFDDALHERVTHDVGRREVVELDAGNVAQD